MRRRAQRISCRTSSTSSAATGSTKTRCAAPRPDGTSAGPQLDEELRARLTRRFGGAIDAWFDELPAVLRRLAERWNLEWGDLIQRGSMSAVIRCAAEGQPAVLKVSPERTRVAHEAAALASWRTKHVPAVLAVDAALGALLIEAIEPGTPLADSRAYPNMESLVALLTSLHEDGASDPSYAAVADHITYLFDSGRKSYERRPDLAALIPPALNERGRQLALRLAADSPVRVLLHGDLTPANVLDGGSERGLVAVDPAPCVGDPAFDAVDLVFWRARDADEIATRAHQLAPAIGADARRLVEWCTAFAGMVALELAEAGNPPEYLEPLLVLSSRLWTTHRIPDPPRPQAN